MILALALHAGAEGGPGESSDLEIGGPGTEPGRFLELRHMAFGPANRLYVLEGRRLEGKDKTPVGNCRVQIFENDGRWVDSFSVLDPVLGDKNDPRRLAVDPQGRVWVSQPERVAQYESAPAGGTNRWSLARTYPVPDAFALTLWRTNGRLRVAALGSRYERNRWVGLTNLHILNPETGTLEPPMPLGCPVAGAVDMTSDRQGNLYVLGEVNQLYQFNRAGQLLAVTGAGTWRRVQDGSELRHSLALDPQGRVYAQAFGNIVTFDPDFKTVTTKPGQFYWYDNWSPHDAYTALAFDADGRFWVAVTGNVALGVRHHFRPAIIRVKPDFFKGLTPTSTLTLGLDPVVTVDLSNHVTTARAPIPFELTVKKAFRKVKDVRADYHIYDFYKTEVSRGSVALKLEDGVEARQRFSFTPPRWGWYTIECALSAPDGQWLKTAGAHVGVTPPFAGMPDLGTNAVPGGAEDPERQAFCGLHLVRTHTREKPEHIERLIEWTRQYGQTLLVQFESKSDCTPEKVREAVTRFQGRVHFWEIVNEPNFSMKPEEYAALLKQIGPLIKQLDPRAQVLGPAVCGIQLGWHEALFKAGAGPFLDAISVHDYEGNESIDPDHWRWKVGELRAVLDRYGLAGKKLWQTERAIGGVRAQNFQGGVQAVRVTLHRDLWETLGVPNERNSHYYMSAMGYSSVPTYLWSPSGPMPAALALRAREAMVMDRRYEGTLDFGPHGNRLFIGLRYRGADGSTVVLRQLGAATDLPLTLGVSAGSTLSVSDSFGNRHDLPVRDGTVALTVPPLPLYLRLAPGQAILPPRLDFGPNLAVGATFTYSGVATNSLASLTNGVLEVTHPSNPWGRFWRGDLATPQPLDIALPAKREVNRVIVFSMRADNPHCYLADFDLQSYDGKEWRTLQEVRTTLPSSTLVNTTDCRANTWYLDQNFALVEFTPVVTDRLRVLARRSTLGFQPDATAVQATGWQAGAPSLHLREIEVFGPAGAGQAAFRRPPD